MSDEFSPNPRGSRARGLAIVLYDVGLLQLFQSGLMLTALVVSLLYAEYYAAVAFVVSAVVTGLVGGALYRRYGDAPSPDTKHALVTAGTGWFVTILFGALPFLFAAYLTPPAVVHGYVPASATYRSSLFAFRNPLHAVFESASGWTTTGLSMAVHEPSIPHGLLWWRTTMQWVGGMGMILLTITIFGRSRGKSGHLLFMSEAREKKIRPSVFATARALWKLYTVVTVVSALYLTLVLLAFHQGSSVGATIWQAVNFAMTAISTGGFSVLDNSIGTYQSALVRELFVPVMLAGGIAYPVYYAVFHDGDTGKVVRSPQTRWLFLLVLFGVPTLTLLNAQSLGLTTAFQQSLFQYVSGLSTTGFQTAPLGDWSAGAVVFLVAGAMFIGGSAGATVGGIKIIRAYLVGQSIRWEITRVFLPEHALADLQLGDETLNREEMEREFEEAAVVALLYAVVLAASLMILLVVVPGRFSLADVLLEVASAQSTVGVSAGITGPHMSAVAESTIILQMWMGRLEIVAVLITFRAYVFGFDFN